MAWAWALPGTCLCHCLPSRCSALNYASLHGTSSSWFMPKPLDYSSLCLAMQVLLLVVNLVPMIPGLPGFQPSLHRKGPIRNLPNIQMMFFSGALKLSKPSQTGDRRWRMSWLVTSFCGASVNISCVTAWGAASSCFSQTSGCVTSWQLLILQSLPKLENMNTVILPLNVKCYDWEIMIVIQE